MTALLRTCRRLVFFVLAIPWLVIAAPFYVSAQDWPEVAAEGQFVGRWEVWHDNQGQMRQFVQIERRADGHYFAHVGHRYFEEESTDFRKIALRVRQDNGDVIIFDKVGDPHSEAFWVMSEGNLAIEDDEGLIQLFDTRGIAQASVAPVHQVASQGTARLSYSESPSGDINSYRKALVRNYAIEEIRTQLVSPRTARFSSLHETRIEQTGDWLYIVAGYVDTQNRLGARVRVQWAAQVECYNEAGSTCRVTRAGLEE